MKHKINLRLGFIAVLAIIASTVGIMLVCYNLFQIRVRHDLKLNAGLLMQTAFSQNVNDNPETAALSRIGSGELRITWVDRDGKVLFDNDTDIQGLGNHLDRPEIRDAIDHGEGESIRTSVTMNMNTYYYARMLEDGTILRVSTQARAISSVFLSALPVILCISVAIMLVCILLGRVLTEQLLRPIEQMAENLDETNRLPVYKELEPFAEKIRSQHEKILAAAKSRQDFTANVTHELKTPITAISGYAELLENGMVEPKDTAYIAGKIRHNAARLLSIVNDSIRLSELDHQELLHNFEHIDLMRVVQECVQESMPSAQARGVRLSCTGEETVIPADKALLRELIDNLLQNAIRYNKDRGSVEVSAYSRSGHAVLSVRDTGIGIPDDQQERIFERFYRVDKSRSRETGGTGLGLAIVKHIAELHNAQITLQSTVGVGTQIEIAF